ncbi:histidine phosphatase family protein [Jeotgalibacillus soli]|nr:histidine phosphatase family protein [Jeotgalibacillus soli]
MEGARLLREKRVNGRPRRRECAEEAPGPPAESESLERKSTGQLHFDQAIKWVWQNESFSFVGGESNLTAQSRGVKATKMVLERYAGKNVVIGTHGNIQVLIMKCFDYRYDFPFWQGLTMPDIYKLIFNEKEIEKVARIVM